MKILNLYITIVILLSTTSTGYCQNLIDTYSKKVPVVVYTPFDFIRTVEGAFSFSEKQHYFLHTDSVIYVYNGHKKTSRVPEIRSNRDFHDVIMKNDSVFYISLIPSLKYVDYYNTIGIYKDGLVKFIDDRGNEYANVEELMKGRFGSVDDFIEKYISSYEVELLFKYRTNGLFVFNIKEAISQLKNDYNFFFQYNPKEQDIAIDMLMNQIVEIKPMSKSQRDVLIKKIKAYINSTQPIDFGDILFRHHQGWDNICFWRYDIDPVLKDYFNGIDYEFVSHGLTVRRAKTLVAYDFLSKAYKKEILETGTGLMDDTSRLNYLKGVIFDDVIEK